MKPDLLFAGTEFGLFFTIDGGRRWVKLGGDVPTIAFRDLAIQRRENDLVGGSFGRGIFVLDDYSALREVTEEALAKEATLFPTRKAWWYVEREPFGEGGKASQGAAYFTAPNPPFGAVFTYHLADDILSREKARQETEKPLIEAGKDTPFPGWTEVEAERREPKPVVVLTVKDAAGNVVRRIEGKAEKGFHRVAWDLRLPSTQAIGSRSRFEEEDGEGPTGVLAAPGAYTVSLAKQVDGHTTELAGPVRFEVARLRQGALPGTDPQQTAAFLRRVAEAERATTAATQAVRQAQERAKALRHRARALALGAGRARRRAPRDRAGAPRDRRDAGREPRPGHGRGRRRRHDLEAGAGGVHERRLVDLRPDADAPAQPRDRGAGVRRRCASASTRVLEQRLPALEQKLEQAGAPWTPGRPVPPLP